MSTVREVQGKRSSNVCVPHRNRKKYTRKTKHKTKEQ
jgi:hypothetical protein